MAELSTLSLSDFTKLAQVKFQEGMDSVPRTLINSGMVKNVPIDNNSGDTREFSEIDANEFLTEKGEGDQAARGKVQQGYSTTMRAKRMAENIGITYEMKTRNKYPEVINALVGGGEKGYKTIERDLAHRLTFASATTYTDAAGNTVDIACGDALALASAVHKLRGTTSTFRNRVANDPLISKGAIEAIERLVVEQTLNQFGEVKTATFDILFTSTDPNTCNTVEEYLKSTSDVTGANSGVVNVYNGKYKHVKIPYLATDANGAPDTTKRGYWGIASSRLSSFYLGMWEAPHMVAPTAGGNGEDVQTDDMEYKNRVGYGITIPGASWIKLSLPTLS